MRQLIGVAESNVHPSVHGTIRVRFGVSWESVHLLNLGLSQLDGERIMDDVQEDFLGKELIRGCNTLARTSPYAAVREFD